MILDELQWAKKERGREKAARRRKVLAVVVKKATKNKTT